MEETFYEMKSATILRGGKCKAARFFVTKNDDLVAQFCPPLLALGWCKKYENNGNIFLRSKQREMEL